MQSVRYSHPFLAILRRLAIHFICPKPPFSLHSAIAHYARSARNRRAMTVSISIGYIWVELNGFSGWRSLSNNNGITPLRSWAMFYCRAFPKMLH
jgi:hypothetical protein